MNTLGLLERRLRIFFGGRFRTAPKWRLHEQMASQAFFVVQVYYVVTAMLLYNSARTLRDVASDTSEMTLLWPIIWLDYVPFQLGLYYLTNAYLILGFLGIILWRFLAIRICVCLVLLQWAAIPNSFGAMNHGLHEWFWLSFCFLFLPNTSQKIFFDTRRVRIQFLHAFSVAPVLILFFYSLSGFYKILDATTSLVTGEFGGFMPDAMAQTVADRALQTMSDPIWASIIIENPYFGWPLYLSLYYVEIVAIVIIFRPQLIKVWGIVLIAFHFGTLAFMDIAFGLHVLINGLLFLMSPFASSQFRFQEAIKQLPLIGIIIGRKY